MVTIKFFMNGDESGRLHTKEFDTEAEYSEYMNDMQTSIEIFSAEGWFEEPTSNKAELNSIHTQFTDLLDELDEYNAENRSSADYEAIEDIYRGIRDQLDELYSIISKA